MATNTNPSITSPTYRGPPCTHHDQVYTNICRAPTAQSEKLTSLHALMTRAPRNPLQYSTPARPCTTFETAVARSDHGAAAYLLKGGVDPDLCGTGMPPLHRAIRNLDARMVALLGEAGAHMNIRHGGVTALKLVARMEDGGGREWAEVKRMMDYYVGRM